MSKTERIFPLNTMGGRIQNRRITILKKKRYEFYDLLRPGENISNDSKSKTIKNWESGETMPDIDMIKKICIALDCSSDYLLGLDTCSTKDIQFINKEIGLSEKNIKELQLIKYTPEITEALNDMFDYNLIDIAISLSLGKKNWQNYLTRKKEALERSEYLKNHPDVFEDNKTTLERAEKMGNALISAKVNVLNAQSRFSKIVEKIIPLNE